MPAWKVPIIARKGLLKQPEIAVSVKFAPDELKAMPDKQFKAFEKEFEKRFTPKFLKMSKDWFSKFQKYIDETEAEIEKYGTSTSGPKDPKARARVMEGWVEGINASLKGDCKDWTNRLQKLAQKEYEAAHEASLKVMKLKITKAKAKMIAKVALFVALTLTAAALTIAASVVSMGAGAALAPVVLAGIVTAGKAIFGSVDEAVKSYDVLGSTIASIEVDAKHLQASADASLKAMQKTAGKLDTASAFYKALSADVSSLDKHVGQLDEYTAVAQDKTKKRLAEIQKLADALAKAREGSPEAAKYEKEVLVAQKSFDGAMSKLKAIDEAKGVAKEARDAFTALKPDAIKKALGKLAPISTKLKSAMAEISKAGSLLKDIGKGVQKLLKA